MTDDLRTLPPALLTKFMSFFRETHGEFEVADRQGLEDFLFEHREQYPVLGGMLKLNEDAIKEHVERTGTAPPGIQVIRKTTEEGSNVTKLEIFLPPNPPEE